MYILKKCFKNTILVFSFFILQQVYAQSLTVKEPDFAGIILLIDADGVNFRKLEKQKVSGEAKQNIAWAILGVAKSKQFNIATGASSPLRTDGKNLRLLVRSTDNLQDPSDVIRIVQMKSEPKKNRRSLLVGDLFFNKSTTQDYDFVNFEAVKYGSSSYLLQLPTLAPGEYALTLEGTRDVFHLMGVDEEMRAELIVEVKNAPEEIL